MLYHKECGIPSNIKMQVLSVLNKFKYNPLSFTNHAREQLKEELNPIDIAKVLYHYVFDYNDVFEVNESAGQVEKIGFRIGFNSRDIVFVISKDKHIVTLWTNSKNDKHSTLNKQIYAIT